MSKDTFDPVTAIASRQPAICPARHVVSPAVLEFRLQQVTAERDALAGRVAELEDCLREVRSGILACIGR